MSRHVVMFHHMSVERIYNPRRRTRVLMKCSIHKRYIIYLYIIIYLHIIYYYSLHIILYKIYYIVSNDEHYRVRKGPKTVATIVNNTIVIYYNTTDPRVLPFTNIYYFLVFFFFQTNFIKILEINVKR